MAIRRQATLYLPPPANERIEALRARFNPAQARLIRAHVTLCREEEVQDWDALSARLAALGAIDVTLEFGMPVREANLVTLPALGPATAFHALRRSLLAATDGGTEPRRAVPHLTLIHPRNGTCSDADFAELQRACVPFSFRFRTVTLIAQHDGGPWQDLATFG